ncbi:putative transcription factor bHLH family [Dioscorea sansibarensis]
MMDSSSNSDDHHHQGLHGSSSLPPPLLPSFHDSNQTFILNNGGFIQSNNGVINSSSRDSKTLGFQPPLSSMVQELGFQWSNSNAPNYVNQSDHNQMKDDFSGSSSITEQLHMALTGVPPFDISSLTSSCSTARCSGNFRPVLPTSHTNISNQINQVVSPLFPVSLGMDLHANLDVFASANKFGRSFSQSSLNNSMALYKEHSRPSHELEHFQDPNQVLSNGYHNKISSLVPGAAALSQTVNKKPRLEQRSSFSPFKVRKEKLGDRIAALQQLVSPFGKTDTASVLMEAIGYIKFLQDQVETLSVPYMRSSGNKKLKPTHGGASSCVEEKEEPKPDLRSRGLCLVPLSCTSYVTNDNAGLWSPPNFRGGT